MEKKGKLDLKQGAETDLVGRDAGRGAESAVGDGERGSEKEGERQEGRGKGDRIQ